MAKDERTGTFEAHGQDPLVAKIRVDPEVPKVEGEPYLVYELRESTTEPAEPPLAALDVSSPPVGFWPELVGCFFAQGPREACVEAARFLGKLGQFVAVRVTHVPLDFTGLVE
jgi:hypothetical protein